MTAQQIDQYRLCIIAREPVKGLANPAVVFQVLREDGTILTVNEAVRIGTDVFVSTNIVFPAPPDEAIMLADLEQCAALALLPPEVTP